jgi:hypothetical protein
MGGWGVDISAPIVLVALCADDAEEASRQLIRIGFTDVGRWLDLSEWVADSRTVRSVHRRQMADLAESLLSGEVVWKLRLRRTAGSDRYELVAGWRRYCAAQLDKLAQVPVVIDDDGSDTGLRTPCLSGHPPP